MLVGADDGGVDPNQPVDVTGRVQERHRRRKGRRGGRPPVFDPEVHRRRDIVERFFNRFKGFRGVASRYDKTATS
ncbi:transposase [Streptomyces albaduncus]|uniref:Transposase n=1 Tax=Streptomyces griseoloalbus TaxID=67303 RepID=A0A7W8F9Q8_9ACTN|nr:transposase [Streptomyces albaduncus]